MVKPAEAVLGCLLVLLFLLLLLLVLWIHAAITRKPDIPMYQETQEIIYVAQLDDHLIKAL